MISLIFGLPGSGKSLLLSYIAYRAVNHKKINFRGFNISTTDYDRIYTNFPCEGAYKLDFDLFGVANFTNCLILIDEIQLFADSRNFRNFGDNLKYFFSMHRHFKIDIVACSQSFSAVDARIRSLTHKLYYVDSIGKFVRVREIISYFDVNKSIQEGYDYASGFNTKYFFAPRLYKYNDTYATIKEIPLQPAPCEPWCAPSEPTTKTDGGDGSAVPSSVGGGST